MECYDDILTQAFAAMKNAYAPYSKYHVGACVKTKDGTYIQGANIENASYGLSNCAERSAIFAAYSQGYRKQDIVSLVDNDDTASSIYCTIYYQNKHNVQSSPSNHVTSILSLSSFS